MGTKRFGLKGFLKEDVMGFFREFHDHYQILKSLNATFLVLILKKGCRRIKGLQAN